MTRISIDGRVSWCGSKRGHWCGRDGQACGEQGPVGFLCTRIPGHQGRHIAAGDGGVLAYEAWPGTHEPDDRVDGDPWTGSTALVGPLRRVVYWPREIDEAPVERWHDLPNDTGDPRVASCFDHHPACHCREANTAEAFAEYRSEMRDAQRIHAAARAALLLHARRRGTWGYRDRCITCHEPYPCPTRVVLHDALWPYPGREDYPL